MSATHSNTKHVIPSSNGKVVKCNVLQFQYIFKEESNTNTLNLFSMFMYKCTWTMWTFVGNKAKYWLRQNTNSWGPDLSKTGYRRNKSQISLNVQHEKSNLCLPGQFYNLWFQTCFWNSHCLKISEFDGFLYPLRQCRLKKQQIDVSMTGQW